MAKKSTAKRKNRPAWGFCWTFALLPAALLLRHYLAARPQLTEDVYSRGIYSWLSRILAPLFGLFPFSVAQVLLAALVLWVLWVVVRGCIRCARRGPAWLLHSLLRLAAAASVLVFLFYAMWGFNYYRQPLAVNLQYKTGSPTAAELSAVTADEIAKINALCPDITYGKDGASTYPGGFWGMRTQVNAGYGWLAADEDPSHPLIGRAFSSPKALWFSRQLAYTGIEGIFVPFTYEPTLNTDYPVFILPFTISHETAHLKGFAREDEANFMAYLACLRNPDVYYQYSGHMNALLYLADALYATDQNQWKEQMSKLDKRAAADLNAYNAYEQRHTGTVDKISNQINDHYLKSQGQSGVVSYDDFVVLLADRYRTGAK